MATSRFSPLVGPLVGLCGWTLVMEAWLYATRIPALNKAVGEGKLKIEPTMTKDDFNKGIPKDVQWKADNYNHLMEQPTQFYATILALIHLQANDRLTVGLAWGYVGVRVVHSFVQSLKNPIMVRFQIFAVSSLLLAGLTAQAAMHII